MSSTLFSRRKLFEAGAAGSCRGRSCGDSRSVVSPAPQEGESELESLFPGGGEEKISFIPAKRVICFLDTMMDAYAQGSTTRLSQSYSDEIGLESTAFV